MIGDVIARSLRQPDRLIPVEALLGNCDGSRMPDVVADLLTPAIAQRLVEVCPTSALGMEEREGRCCLKLSYRECIGCGKCVEWGEGAVVTAKKFTVCGVAKDQTVRRWDLDARTEITLSAPRPEASTHANSLSPAKGAQHSPARLWFL